jgi:alpha-galactosidase
MPTEPSIDTGRHLICIEGDPEPFVVRLNSRELADNLHIVNLTLRAADPAVPPPLSVVFSQPMVDTHGRWHPGGRSNRAIYPEWDSRFTSQMTRYAPLVSFYSIHGENRLTVATSDVVEPVYFQAGVFEETASLQCRLKLFERPRPAVSEIQLQLRIDTRAIPFSQAMGEVTGWWETDGENAPCTVPESARVPLYSTWYSFHQSLVVDDVVEQCRLARELGCEAVIVDDGWQTTDANRGYAFTGDWTPERIGDMSSFVHRVHDVGMKFLLWYSLPFAGRQSQAFRRFAKKTLRQIDSAKAAVLDPRYADVRAYLIGVLETAMREWDLDGFKLDFIDWLDPSHAGEPGAGADIESLTDATHQLLSEINARLGRIKSEPLIEFRQPYTGPRMRRYANMFRSVDCPNDAYSNRINTIDLRLTSGGTAVHSDMFMWHRDDPVESAALQILSVLFAVPQVSVRIDKLPENHRAMLRFWLGFWREHRETLLDGELTPLQPQALYPAVIAESSRERIAAIYDETVLPVADPCPDRWYVVNAALRNRVVMDVAEGGIWRLRIFDCTGQRVAEEQRLLREGAHALDIPPAGLAEFTRT